MQKRLDYICTMAATVGIILQPDEILRYISLLLTCVSVSISIAYTIYKWRKEIAKDKASKDKKDDIKGD